MGELGKPGSGARIVSPTASLNGSFIAPVVFNRLAFGLRQRLLIARHRCAANAMRWPRPQH
jgi:hypothetical protein